MAAAVAALDYLAHPGKHPVTGVCAVFGDEAFLKRQVLAEIKANVLAGEDADFSVTVFDGRELALRDVMDALATRALFGGGRHLVIVEEADDFVSENRAALEDYVARGKSDSVLVLDVKQWASTTRLAKALAESGLQVECKFPPAAKLTRFLGAWAKKRHGAELDSEAAELLVESVEADLGLLDQELAKLAASVPPGGTITPELISQVVLGWRAQTVWAMLEAALEGQSRVALVQLDHLLLSGEAPIKLLAQIGASLRRFGAATRLIEQADETRRRITLRSALAEAGVKPFVLARAEEQLRRLGRPRAKELYRRLLEADLALKGTSSSPARARLVLEELIVRLSAALQPASR